MVFLGVGRLFKQKDEMYVCEDKDVEVGTKKTQEFRQEKTAWGTQGKPSQLNAHSGAFHTPRKPGKSEDTGDTGQVASIQGTKRRTVVCNVSSEDVRDNAFCTSDVQLLIILPLR